MNPGKTSWLGNVSIKWKLTLIIMVSSMAGLLLISGAFVAYELATFKQSMRNELSSLAKFIGVQNDGALLYDKNEDAYDSLGALSAKPHIVSACIYNRKGEIFATYPKNISRDLLPPHPERDGSQFENSKEHLTLFRRITDNGEIIGTVYLESDLKELHERLLQYGSIILLFVLISALVTFFLSTSLQKIISDPILQLAVTAGKVSAEKNYTLRAVRQSRDELGQFVEVFNEMLARIEEREAALQQANNELEKRVGARTQDLKLEITERQRAQEGLQQQLTRISLLNQITQVISERRDLSSILQVVLRQLEDHLPVDMGAVLLTEANGERLTVSATQEKNPGEKLILPLQSSLFLTSSGLAQCAQGMTVYVPDTRELTAELPYKLAASGIRCAVAVPLMVEGKLFGVLTVARRGVNSFSSGESEFLRMLSEHVALAAHQAHLHAELETAYNDLRESQLAVMQQDRLRALGQMASGIAHDVNNALSPVVGYAGLLLEYEPNLSDKAKKQLNYIKIAGEDVAHTVARLREFYRKRDDREPGLPIGLNELATQVIEMTRPRWRDIPQGRGIMVELKTSFTEESTVVAGVEAEVREALTNLILNSVDAMPQGGALTLQTRTRAIAPGLNGENFPTHVLLEVIDTGMGMSKETLEHCLEPFYSTKGVRGTGIGLAMVYGVMERHEGKIEIESEPGRGTTVRLIFPILKQTSAKVVEKPAARSAAPRQILCIDDEPLLRELVREMLESDGHKVEVADSGRAGLSALQAAAQQGRPFDIVFTDLGMPYMDGREVARFVKLESPRTPVVLLTGWGAFMKSDGDMPEHVDGLLSKPPRLPDLRDILGRLMAG